MKKLVVLLTLITAISLPAAVKNGQQAPGFTLTDLSGESVSLSDFSGKTVVLEWINTGCPFVQKFYREQDMPRFQKQAAEKGVVWISINSTKAGHPQYMDASASSSWAQSHGHSALWLLDAEGEVGKAYGARTTPHMFVIDASGKVVYQGAIDSKADTRPASISEATNYVMNALTSLEEGTDIEVPQTKPYGCGIKY